MKKIKKSIDQLKKLSVSVISKDQQGKVKGGIKRKDVKIPGHPPH